MATLARLYNIADSESLPLIWPSRLMQGCPDLGCAEDLKLDTEYKAASAAEAQFNASKLRRDRDRATLNRVGCLVKMSLRELLTMRSRLAERGARSEVLKHKAARQRRNRK